MLPCGCFVCVRSLLCPWQKLFRGWRVRAEMGELMISVAVLQHPFRDLINFRTWRFAVCCSLQPGVRAWFVRLLSGMLAPSFCVQLPFCVSLSGTHHRS